tara:strand:- start:89 stop:1378 length:1290 start_codon:yes stop_codon:yes gene_type:complete
MASIFTTSKNVTAKVPFGGDVRIPFYLQFVPGIVVDTIVHPSTYKGYNNSNLVNSIMATPHITEDTKKRKLNLNEDNRYFPLMRGIFEVPAKGDPVLLCTIAGIRYYLGPLNTENNPNWNIDNLYSSDANLDTTSSSELNSSIAQGESQNFKKINLNRLGKRYIKQLDGEDAYNETHGDIMLEGRHGNSIRVGSRNVNPYIFISNARASKNNIQETLYDGSLISITENGTLFDHFGSVVEASNLTGDGENTPYDATLTQYDGFKLASDLIETPNRLMEKLISSVNNNQSPIELINEYADNQMLFNSDRITINTRVDDIYLSSNKDIHIGTGRHLTISTNEDLIVESEKTYLGNPNKETNKDKMQKMVFGDLLLEVLQETLTALKGAQGLCTGAPIPLVDSTMAPLSVKIIEIENKLSSILSNKHFIEPN